MRENIKCSHKCQCSILRKVADDKGGRTGNSQVNVLNSIQYNSLTEKVWVLCISLIEYFYIPEQGRDHQYRADNQVNRDMSRLLKTITPESKNDSNSNTEDVPLNIAMSRSSLDRSHSFP